MQVSCWGNPLPWEVHNKALSPLQPALVAPSFAFFPAISRPSPKLRISGILDEVITLSNGELSPFDYKYAEYRDSTFKTHKVQSTLYAMLIQEIYLKPEKKGFICYVRKGARIKEIEYSKNDFKYAETILEEIFTVIPKGFYPKSTRSKVKCFDCCYKNICV